VQTSHSPRSVRLILGALLGLFVAGCAGVRIKNSPREQQLLSVPFFPDNTDQCGPSALSSVLTFWGASIAPAELKKEIYLAHLKGSLPLDLLLSAENHGFKARLYSGGIEDVKSQLRKGEPLIAFINRGFDFYPIGHYVVVVGYDEERRGLYVHSGLKKNRFVSYKRFLRDWDKTERSTLLILPSERDKEFSYSTSSDFNAANENDVVRYEAALQNKKKYTPGLIVLGNLAYERGDLKRAEGFYRQVLRTDRNDAGANNNLAMVYLTRGKNLDKAERFARIALRQGGPLQPYVLETLASIYLRQNRTLEARKILDEADGEAPSDNAALCEQLSKTRDKLAN